MSTTTPVILEERFLINPRTYHRPEIVIFIASLVTIATGLILSYGFHINRTACLAVLGTGGGEAG